MGTFRKAKIYLSLGTNIGDRENNLSITLTCLGRELSSLKHSHIYKTLPLYVKNQPEFLNCIVSGETGKSPLELLDYLLNLEKNIGRNRTNFQEKGPRVIDIDILLYKQEIINQKRLQIPHPGMYERQFVLIPLLELQPGLRDPVSGHPFSFFLEKLQNQGVTFYAESIEQNTLKKVQSGFDRC
jgi:2-amino-4-hydroxy-6-hydroxymethyldihydropteridine diphosphokinase